ncbi:response regulator transcription factor [Streptomonospora algeriensis]|uniref:Response regulator transcription factor n=1 Tax=Streptomonospora algeriensis TaxID=995084 RepID=A0ABW3BFE0_9ACTN
MTIRVAVADRRRLISEAISAFLDSVHDFDVVEAVEESEECGDVVSRVLRLRPSAALLGAVGAEHGVFELAGKIRAEAPECGVVVLASNPTQDVVDEAMANAVSIIPGNARLPHLVHAIRGAVAGCPTIHPALLRSRGQADRRLNDREREVLRLTVRGAPIKEIAAELYLAPGTVRNLASSAIKKLQGRNRFDAARIAASNGWI